MASLTKKKIRGKTYYYLRECKRVNGKPKIVRQRYLGRAEDILTAVEERKGFPPSPVREGIVTEWGAVAALHDLAKRLRFTEIVDKHVSKRGKGPTVGEYLLAAVLNRCVAPCSKVKVGEWFEGTVLPRMMKIEGRQLSSQRFWDNMDRVTSQGIEGIEGDLTAGLVEAFGLDLGHLIFDGTNFFTFLDTFNERSALAARGKSKEGRKALRIVGLAMLVTSDFHVPLFHHTYPGNQHDAPTFAGLTDRLLSRCERLADGIEDVTLVFDKGNNSAGNLGAVDASRYHFVGSLVPTQHPELLAIPRERFQKLSEMPEVSVYRTTKEVFGELRTVVVVYNPELNTAQCKTLLREIAKRLQWFRELGSSLERGKGRKGKKATPDAVRKKVAGWLRARHMKDLFSVEVAQEAGYPVLAYQLNHEAWEKLQATLLGKAVLFTDNHNWSDAQIVRAYRSQHHIEDAFRQMKATHHISLRPQFHWTDQKIRVHVFTCVVALMLLSLLRRELHQKGITLSIARMLDLLGGIREISMFFPGPDSRSKPVSQTTFSKMSDEQRRIFEALDLSRFAAA